MKWDQLPGFTERLPCSVISSKPTSPLVRDIPTTDTGAKRYNAVSVGSTIGPAEDDVTTAAVAFANVARLLRSGPGVHTGEGLGTSTVLDILTTVTTIEREWFSTLWLLCCNVK